MRNALPSRSKVILGLVSNCVGSMTTVPKSDAHSQHPGVKVIGNSEDLVRQCRQGSIDVVYVALPLRAELRTAGLLSVLADTTVTVYLVADFLYYSLLRAQWSQVGNIPVVSVHDSPFQGVVGWVKRLEDLVLGSVIVLLTAIPMICIAVAIKFSSAWPSVLPPVALRPVRKEDPHTQVRTMKVCEDGPSVVQASRNDARVTTVGRFLRRTSLDEFPQFLQVLTGELSLVGPRPHAVAHNEHTAPSFTATCFATWSNQESRAGRRSMVGEGKRPSWRRWNCGFSTIWNTFEIGNLLLD